MVGIAKTVLKLGIAMPEMTIGRLSNHLGFPSTDYMEDFSTGEVGSER
jgi:hypothetical protein